MPLTSQAALAFRDRSVSMHDSTLPVPGISSGGQKRRGRGILIISNSAWHTELSTCPSPRLLTLSKMAICFYCGSPGRGCPCKFPHRERIWGQMLSAKRALVLLRYSMALVLEQRKMGYCEGADRTRVQSIVWNVGVTKATPVPPFRPPVFWCSPGWAGRYSPLKGSNWVPVLALLEWQATPQASQCRP